MNKKVAIEIGWIIALFLISLLGAYDYRDNTFSRQMVFTVPNFKGSAWINVPSILVVGGIFIVLTFIVFLIKVLYYRFKRQLLNLIFFIATVSLIGYIGYIKFIFSDFL